MTCAPAPAPAPSAVPAAHVSHALPALPASATPTGQVLAGGASLLLGCWAVFGLGLFGDLTHAVASQRATAFLVLVLGAGMTAYDLVWLRPQRRALGAAGPRGFSAARVLRKWLGLHLVLAACASLYWVLQEYHGPLYQPFFSLCRAGLPVFSLLCLPYIAWVDARMAQPHDAYWQLGEGLLSFIGALTWTIRDQAAGGLVGQREAGQRKAGQREVEPVAWQSMVLGWAVKFFFLPLMVGYAVRHVQALAGMPWPAVNASPRLWFELAMALLYFVDVVWGAVGYLWSLRLTDSQVRSTEPTALGWLVALACYEPISRAVFPAYFAYGGGPAWGHWFAGQPVAYALWALLIVALTAVYAGATVAFGLRFSNLTHRGIITSGPYRWLRHPAYVSKNLSWWLISMPFMVHTHWTDSLRLCLMLLAVNGVYWLRARTEERHLLQDPMYGAYVAALQARRRRLRAAFADVFPAASLAASLAAYLTASLAAFRASPRWANWGRLPASRASPAPTP